MCLQLACCGGIGCRVQVVGWRVLDGMGGPWAVLSSSAFDQYTNLVGGSRSVAPLLQRSAIAPAPPARQDAVATSTELPPATLSCVLLRSSDFAHSWGCPVGQSTVFLHAPHPAPNALPQWRGGKSAGCKRGPGEHGRGAASNSLWPDVGLSSQTCLHFIVTFGMKQGIGKPMAGSRGWR